MIGNRAFHRDPAIVAQLVHALQIGLRKGGMPTVGKHFPDMVTSTKILIAKCRSTGVRWQNCSGTTSSRTCG